MNYLSNYLESLQSEAMNKNEAFFAFGKKQFEEKRKDGYTYVSMHGGLICPKENINQLQEDLESALVEAVKLDVGENSAESIIQREYFNYESQLSGDTDNAYNSLYKHRELFPDLFSDEIIKEAFKNAFNLAVENDWF